MILDWDYRLKPQDVAFMRRGMTQSGPLSLSGRSQVWQYDAGYWAADLTRIGVKRKNIKLFRRFTAMMEGGANQVRVPTFDKFNQPWPVAGVYSAPSTGYTDGTHFSDGTGFSELAIKVRLLSDASVRATAINVTIEASGDIEGGEYFSHKDHLYLITRVLASIGTDQTWAIWPPLREEIRAGRRLNFDKPVCRMKLVNEGADDLNLEWLKYGFPNLSFMEVFDPPVLDDQGNEMSCCIKTQRKITDPGDVVLPPDSEDIIVIAKTVAASTQVTLPLAISRPGRRPIRIVDGKYDAAINNITIVRQGTNLIMGGTSWIIDSNGASIEFTPLADGSGWM